MPYLDKGTKNYIQPELDSLFKKMTPENFDQSAGTLNYIFTMLALNYIKDKGLSYQTTNDIEGALQSCSKEFYRRVTSIYEDKKISMNGDVFNG